MVTSSTKPACSRPPSHCGLLTLLILALFPYSTCTSSSSPAKSYDDRCGSIVPPSTPTSGGTIDYISLGNGFFSGGDELLAPDNTSSVPGYFYFSSRNLHPTRTPGILKLDGSLYLSGPTQSHASFYTSSSGRGRRRRNRHKTVVYSSKTVSFEMTGFWSKPSGRICMVGAGHVSNNQGTILSPTAVLKLNYPQASDASTSLVNGSIESLGPTDSPAHFQPVSLLAYAQNNYSYTKIPQAQRSCSRVDGVPKDQALGFEDGFSAYTCSNFVENMLGGWFELERGRDACSVLDCRLLGGGGFVPRFMSWSLVGCSEDGKVHMYVTFSGDADYERRNAMQPEKSLVAEGVWDQEKNRLCVLAFPIIIPNNSAADAFIGDNAAIGISLWLPRVLSIETRSMIVGRIWSENTAGGSLPSSRAISFRNTDTTRINHLPGIRYEYTRTHDVNTKSCRSSRGRSLENGTFPDGTSIGDLRFALSFKNREGWGSAVPLSLGESFYGFSVGSFNPILVPEEEEANTVLRNVSYKLSYISFNSSRPPVDISAEGTYNAETGTICMVGCRDQITNSNLHKNSSGFPMDCEISISIQLAPMNTGDHRNGSFDGRMHLNGTIRSTRKKDDPLYFEPFEMSSYNMYATEAIRTIWRMDVEIVIVLVSKTLSCSLIGLQLSHIRKHPQVLPSISVGMLVGLALGHVTLLVLNFEAQFLEDTNGQDVLLWSGGWLEANEAVVRLTTLLAFLLQLRLLQSAWNARSSDDNKKSLWAAERKALGCCLPLYFAGALIAWFVHDTRSRLTNQAQPELQAYDVRHGGSSVWEDLMSYAGLLLDGFLLPQIVLNVTRNCTGKALSPLYYVGTTVVRAFPHAYDAYRSHHYVPSIDSSIIFATPHEGFYSYAWDIVIPFGGVLFAVLLFFQQKFGGRCFLPERFRSASIPERFRSVAGYELVSVETN